MKIFLLTCLYTKEKYEILNRNAIKYFDNAANNYQWGLLEGLSFYLGNGLTVINTAAIGNFPKNYKKTYVRGEGIRLQENGTTIHDTSFFTLPVIKQISKLFTIILELLIRRKPGAGDNVIAYSLTIPLVLPALLTKYIYRTSISVVIPDLPKNMSINRLSIGLILRKINYAILYSCIKRFDNYILVTSHMAEKLKIPLEKAVIIEGVSSVNYIKANCSSTKEYLKKTTVITYAGSLCLKYGILELLDAFCEIKRDDVKLVLCGYGDAEELIIKRSKTDHRVSFLGKLSREQSLRVLKESDFLINPRLNDSEYTRYSFPSKIIEYLSMGVPTIARMLDGIPDGYKEYLITINGDDTQSIKNAIIHALSLSIEDRNDLGTRAQYYIFNNKNAYLQAKSILTLIGYKNVIVNTR